MPVMRTYTDADIRRTLAAHVAEHGVRGTARQLNVGASLVSAVGLGQRPPGPKLAASLGYVSAGNGKRWLRKRQDT